MACISFGYSPQPSNPKVAENTDERTDSYSQAIPTKTIDYEYTLTLLLGALNHLACDTALRNDIDPDYLFTKSLLASSMDMGIRGVKEAKKDLCREHYWLIDLLKQTTAI